MGLDGDSMGLYGALWDSMGLDGARWDSTGLDGTRWDSMGLDGTRWRTLKPGHTLRIIPRSASDILCFLGPFAARGMLHVPVRRKKDYLVLLFYPFFECVSPKYLSKCINCREKVCAKEVILGLMFLLTCFLPKVIVTVTGSNVVSTRVRNLMVTLSDLWRPRRDNHFKKISI